MMHNTTHNSPETEELIDTALGKRFTLWKKIQMKGIGSRRMVLKRTSPNFDQYTNKVADINYVSIELRPKGILVHLTKGLKNFAWAIPYYQLAFFKSEEFSIHGQGNFLAVACNNNYRANKGFFTKLNTLKENYL
jgi:hypothetical protein